MLILGLIVKGKAPTSRTGPQDAERRAHANALAAAGPTKAERAEEVRRMQANVDAQRALQAALAAETPQQAAERCERAEQRRLANPNWLREATQQRAAE